ncbi:MAG: uridine kinase [Actinomycetota bacterium]|nr:uridine kinase [Actinomycetota bacterium]
MRPRPVRPDRLPEQLADLIVAAGAGRLTVALDGAPAAQPEALADAMAGPLRLRGRPVVPVSATDFLRPASVRLEHGHHDPQSYRSGWLDAGALCREVLEPFGSSGSYLPSLWDAAGDRPTRAAPMVAPPDAVLLVDGAFLLDQGLRFDLSIHLRLSHAALARRTVESLQWTLPAYAGYHPERVADVVIHYDDPRHPAVAVQPLKSAGPDRTTRSAGS